MRSFANYRWIVAIALTVAALLVLLQRPPAAEAQGGPEPTPGATPTKTNPGSVPQCSFGDYVSAPIHKGSKLCSGCSIPPPTTPPDENKEKETEDDGRKQEATTEGGGRPVGARSVTPGGDSRPATDMPGILGGCLDPEAGAFVCGTTFVVGGGCGPLCNGMPEGMNGMPPAMPPVGDDAMVVDPTQNENTEPNPPPPT